MKKIYFHRLLMPSVLDGSKWMTRRVIPQSVLDEYDDYLTTCMLAGAVPTKVIEKSRYKVGEVVAIAQSYKSLGYDIAALGAHAGWNNKLYVCAEFMPSRILFTGIKVERLQDISDEDCEAEGVLMDYKNCSNKHHGVCYWSEVSPEMDFHKPQEAFVEILRKCCTPKTLWDDNPWVFSYSYKIFTIN